MARSTEWVLAENLHLIDTVAATMFSSTSAVATKAYVNECVSRVPYAFWSSDQEALLHSVARITFNECGDESEWYKVTTSIAPFIAYILKNEYIEKVGVDNVGHTVDLLVDTIAFPAISSVIDAYYDWKDDHKEFPHFEVLTVSKKEFAGKTDKYCIVASLKK